MLVAWLFCVYACKVYVAMSDTDTNGTMIELSQVTQSKCDCLQCSVLEKLNPSTNWFLQADWLSQQS